MCSVGDADPDVVVAAPLPLLLVALPTDVNDGPSEDPREPFPAIVVPFPFLQFSTALNFSTLSFIRAVRALLARVPKCWYCGGKWRSCFGLPRSELNRTSLIGLSVDGELARESPLMEMS